VSCITRAIIVRGQDSRTDTLEFGSFEHQEVLLHLHGTARLELSLVHTFTLKTKSDNPRQWTASSRDYFYHLREHHGPELIAFHWHPGRANQPDFPHLHVTGRAGSVAIDRKQHVPTGRVSLESVVRFAIVELGVRPLRPDWERVLDAGQAEFDARRTW
jgi:hypothetical protein